MVFGLIEDAFDAVLDTVSDTFDSIVSIGEEPDEDNVKKLIDAGLTVAEISIEFGVVEAIIEVLSSLS